MPIRYMHTRKREQDFRDEMQTDDFRKDPDAINTRSKHDFRKATEDAANKM